jgi:hypothetical protein
MKEPAQKCSVTRSLIRTLIEAFVYTVGSTDYEAVADDDHYRGLVSRQVEAILLLAEELELDVWKELEAPVGRDDTPIAVLLREADAKFGMPPVCAVPGCTDEPMPCCQRPDHLPARTRWPSCPELCAQHSAMRYDVLASRVKRQRPQHRGPIHVGLMPMPAVADLAPTPEEMARLEASPLRLVTGTGP